jgi:type I restriction enzyme R subunit
VVRLVFGRPNSISSEEGARVDGERVLVKRILRKHGYPPDLQDEATKLVLQQAELLCAEWAA